MRQQTLSLFDDPNEVQLHLLTPVNRFSRVPIPPIFQNDTAVEGKFKVCNFSKKKVKWNSRHCKLIDMQLLIFRKKLRGNGYEEEACIQLDKVIEHNQIPSSMVSGNHNKELMFGVSSGPQIFFLLADSKEVRNRWFDSLLLHRVNGMLQLSSARPISELWTAAVDIVKNNLLNDLQKLERNTANLSSNDPMKMLTNIVNSSYCITKALSDVAVYLEPQGINYDVIDDDQMSLHLSQLSWIIIKLSGCYSQDAHEAISSEECFSSTINIKELIAILKEDIDRTMAVFHNAVEEFVVSYSKATGSRPRFSNHHAAKSVDLDPLFIKRLSKTRMLKTQGFNKKRILERGIIEIDTGKTLDVEEGKKNEGLRRAISTDLLAKRSNSHSDNPSEHDMLKRLDSPIMRPLSTFVQSKFVQFPLYSEFTLRESVSSLELIIGVVDEYYFEEDESSPILFFKQRNGEKGVKGGSKEMLMTFGCSPPSSASFGFSMVHALPDLIDFQTFLKHILERFQEKVWLEEWHDMVQSRYKSWLDVFAEIQPPQSFDQKQKEKLQEFIQSEYEQYKAIKQKREIKMDPFVLNMIRKRIIDFAVNIVSVHKKIITPEDTSLLLNIACLGIQNKSLKESSTILKHLFSPELIVVEKETISSVAAPAPLYPEIFLKKGAKACTLQDFDVMEIARQMFIIDFAMFKKVKPEVVLHWNKKNRGGYDARDEISIMDHFNAVSKWVATEVLKHTLFPFRVQVYQRFIDLMDCCKRIQNFNALTALIAGLQSAPINRLSHTKNAIDQEHKNKLQELVEFNSHDQNYKTIREYQRGCSGPVIPFLGIYLSDITFIDEGNNDYLSNGHLNWTKSTLKNNVVNEINNFQERAYNYEKIDFLQVYFQNLRYENEEQNFEVSLEREPRGATLEEIFFESVNFDLL